MEEILGGGGRSGSAGGTRGCISVMGPIQDPGSKVNCSEATRQIEPDKSCSRVKLKKNIFECFNLVIFYGQYFFQNILIFRSKNVSLSASLN